MRLKLQKGKLPESSRVLKYVIKRSGLPLQSGPFYMRSCEGRPTEI